MNIKDLKEETELKISFPDESEIEDDVHRILLTTHTLMEYLLDLGLEPGAIYQCILRMALQRYFDDQLDLDFARQETQNWLYESVSHSFNRRKELQEDAPQNADFFSIFINHQLPPSIQ